MSMLWGSGKWKAWRMKKIRKRKLTAKAGEKMSSTKWENHLHFEHLRYIVEERNDSPFQEKPAGHFKKKDRLYHRCYWQIQNLEKREGFFRRGSWQLIFRKSRVSIYEKRKKDQRMIIGLNQGGKEYLVEVESEDPLGEFFTGRVHHSKDGKVFFSIDPGEGMVLSTHFCYPNRIRKAGILAHVSSLPSPYGIGDMGPGCHQFIDFLHQAGHRIWQILPLNPVDEKGSPYAGWSGFAGNIYLISPEILCEKGYLTVEEIEEEKTKELLSFPQIRERKDRLFEKAYSRFCGKENRGYQKFCQENKEWLKNYALYCILKEKFSNTPWQEWPSSYAFRDFQALDEIAEQLSGRVEYHQFLQYEFQDQWNQVLEKARSQSILIIGDVPLYVAMDSVDVWSHPELFELDSAGAAEFVAGVPPDYFSDQGQLWERNPTYRWKESQKTDFRWWKQRIAQCLKRCDLLRLDHFRGFKSYWQIPAGCSSAIYGTWKKGPGEEFFQSMERNFEVLPFVAEDLGSITHPVGALKNRFALPGIEVLQFGRWGEKEQILYTGTHDNDTLLGWVQKSKNNPNYRKVLRKAKIPATLSEEEIAEELLRFTYQSENIWLILPLQDVLGLDDQARMNTPGTTENNWSWRFRKEDLNPALQEKLIELVKWGERCPEDLIDEVF